MNRGRGKERGVDLAVALAVQSLAMAVFVRQWCCFKRWRERLFFSSPLFSFFLFCCVSHHLFIISVSSFFPISYVLPSICVSFSFVHNVLPSLHWLRGDGAALVGS